ncbi:phosphatidate cytidylyltransferase, mitochondrial-like isoform X2 [Pollicipes pollicipes]|uniref:phosphatidate cytidylyltransferase, mitochondrial-like isoform X2 n=1 Tax=Pollicipes pollicipes TaxID=41117 RepID=UPI001885A11D|nr:phosphatidate cytidylyltransferase, mitochondrial-like isoform X2 [Pollicipes pollicipes]
MTFFTNVCHYFLGRYLFAFAYGSSVFNQKNNTKADRMVDFIFAVDDPQAWHEANIAKNPRHYSFLKYLGSGTVASCQKDYGAKVYFNTLIPVENGTIKYGVISTAALLSDLLDWDTLYVAGRLHKPCRVLLPPANDDLQTAMKLNLQSALHTALLLLPSHFTERELYTKITSLSYTGDFRMWVGEDKNKVANIVDGQVAEFCELYAPARESLSEYMEVVEGAGRQDVSPAARLYHLTMLPRELQVCLARRWNRDGRHRDVEDVLRAAACDIYSSGVIVRGLGDIVRMRNIAQSVKGVLTAGVVKSVRYSARKLVKMFRSMWR